MKDVHGCFRGRDRTALSAASWATIRTIAWLQHVGQIPALLFPHDIPSRRRAEAVIRQVRQGIADECQRRADEYGREIGLSSAGGSLSRSMPGSTHPESRRTVSGRQCQKRTRPIELVGRWLILGITGSWCSCSLLFC